MPRILIISMRDDPHTRAVQWGLRALGHEPVVWCWSEFPQRETAALHIGQQGVHGFRLGLDAAGHAGPFDVIWVRRREAPVPMAGTHPDDAAIVLSETNKFFDNLLPRLGHEGTRWINHPDADHRCRNKVGQLLAARSIGLRIPDTLVGNAVDDVRAFLARHPGGIVHKAFSPLYWENEDGSRTVGRTSLVTAAHLAGDFVVRACPGIYQEKLEKQYELRVTVMGDTVLAAAIDSQRDGPTIDWRHDGDRGDNLRASGIPSHVADACRALCRALGLAFGCIDLVVTPQDEVIFLEINCVGQFLFNELADPGMPMLDTFCRYLATGHAHAAERPEERLAMARFLAWEQAGQPAREVA